MLAENCSRHDFQYVTFSEFQASSRTSADRKKNGFAKFALAVDSQREKCTHPISVMFALGRAISLAVSLNIFWVEWVSFYLAVFQLAKFLLRPKPLTVRKAYSR